MATALLVEKVGAKTRAGAVAVADLAPPDGKPQAIGGTASCPGSASWSARPPGRSSWTTGQAARSDAL